MDKKLKIAITQGDTNGVGYEMILKTFAEPEILELCTPVIYGSVKVATYYSKALNLNCHFHIVESAAQAMHGKVNLVVCYEETTIEAGTSTDTSVAEALLALDTAMTDVREGRVDALVCCPMQGSFKAQDMQFGSMLEYIRTSADGGKDVLPVYVNDFARVVIASGSRELRNASGSITLEGISAKVVTLHKVLKQDYRITNPRIAVLAFNTTADGKEETEVLRPAVEALAEKSVQVFGPYEAHDFFSQRKHEAFDGVVAMYHDQGIVPMGMLSDTAAVISLGNTTMVCTTPDSDAQLSIAGKGIADESVLRHCIYRAIDTVRYRAEYNAPLANPLPKLYHERPDNGEKLRFSVKKGE